MILGAVLLAAAAGAPALAGAPSEETLHYVLDAAPGIPGAVRLTAAIDRPGLWRVEAEWTGRSLSLLKVEDDAGQPIGRLLGPSPLVIELPVPAGTIDLPARWRVRFAPTTATGRLDGEIRLVPPPAPAPVEPAPVAAGFRPGAPGACLARAAGEDAAGRALQQLAQALATAGPDGLAWGEEWAARLADFRGEEDARGRLPRDLFDRTWKRIRLESSPGEELLRGVRAVLAALESLVRTEERGGPAAAGARARRHEVLEVLGCL